MPLLNLAETEAEITNINRLIEQYFPGTPTTPLLADDERRIVRQGLMVIRIESVDSSNEEFTAYSPNWPGVVVTGHSTRREALAAFHDKVHIAQVAERRQNVPK